MKKLFNKYPLLWAFLALILVMPAGCNSVNQDDQSQTELLLMASDIFKGTPLTVLMTNDRHSRFLGSPYDMYNPAATGDNTVGGSARMATLFKEERELNSDTLVLDAGDFCDGTIFIAAEDGAGDMNMLKNLGYDAACLGNHEMGMGPEGLAQMIIDAEKGPSGEMTPLLCANITFSSDDTLLGHSDDALEDLYGTEGEPGKYIFPSIIRTTDSGIKVGIFGLMGENVFMPDAKPCTFPVEYTFVQGIVDDLRDNQDADVVICLMHAGININAGNASGEVADLAENVTGIDLICAGHSHIEATAAIPSQVSGSNWTTTIIEAGHETEKIGKVKLYLNDGIVNTGATYKKIISVDDTIVCDSQINDMIDDYMSDIELNYLTNFPQLHDGNLFDVLAEADFSFGILNSMNMVSDAMRSVSSANIALCTPGGDTAFVKTNSAGEITVYDAFTAMPHGMGRDGLHGGPLYKFNLFAAEVQGILELGTCNMGQGDSDLFVLPSGVKIIFDTSLLRAGTGQGYIIQMYLVSEDEMTETLIFDRVDTVNFPYGGWKYMPGTNWGPGDPYQMLSVSTTQLTLIGLKEISDSDGAGGIDLWPRTAVGAQVNWSHISELDQFVLSGGAYEVKVWYSVAQYIDGFTDGEVDDRYDDEYSDGTTHNPIGPAWRRVWDVAEYGMP